MLLYLGPGVATSSIVIAVGVIAIIGVFLFTFLWFPIKRFIKKMKQKKDQ